MEDSLDVLFIGNIVSICVPSDRLGLPPALSEVHLDRTSFETAHGGVSELHFGAESEERAAIHSHLFDWPQFLAHSRGLGYGCNRGTAALEEWQRVRDHEEQ